jgi:hypothetical protein
MNETSLRALDEIEEGADPPIGYDSSELSA